MTVVLSTNALSNVSKLLSLDLAAVQDNFSCFLLGGSHVHWPLGNVPNNDEIVNSLMNRNIPALNSMHGYRHSGSATGSSGNFLADLFASKIGGVR